MLIVLSSTCLLFSACALLYQADVRRSAFAGVRASRPIRLSMRAGAVLVFAVTLTMLATLQGWELGVPIWLGIFSAVFVAGLFLSAQKPDWHVSVSGALGVIGIVLALGALLS